ncbi:hypothetical protein INT45_014230 [Circinella minor]|uniref:Arrestin C-terminal-like domain-containing protein n=1 Tax=Circinella minor TaxID=1195481 RepID=A0A8H7SDU7_9FUNG|nr:hypothetical protein INT45_014230 [Circinella minor]
MTFTAKKNYLRLILDEPVSYLGNTNGTIVVRGEVIVNFTKDTPIQGPIELLFEGLQRFYPWREIMGSSSPGKPIDTKLHVIELSLLPPNLHGIMPSGIQRFPFEFPLPGSLPITLHIPDRLDISYKLTATLRKSSDDSSSMSFLDRFNKKQKMVSTASLRLVRAIEPITSLTPRQRQQQQGEQQPSMSTSPQQHQQSSSAATTRVSTSALPSGDLLAPSAEEEVINGPHRRTSLDRYFDLSNGEEDGVIHPSYFGQFHLGLALDEQHDRLAYSMAGRTVDNWGRPADGLEYGLRYRLGIDRTAIAIGTSIGIEVLLEPLLSNIKIRSIVTRLSETREYTMKVPGDHSGAHKKGQAETKQSEETLAMVLKWAYGYPTEHDGSSSCTSSSDPGQHHEHKNKNKERRTLSRRYRHHRSHWSDEVHSNRRSMIEKGSSNGSNYDTTRNNGEGGSDVAGFIHPYITEQGKVEDDHDKEDDPQTCGELLNLKSLYQPVHVGEYFEGRFVMPVPTCEHFLRPTMVGESVSIRHWLDLIVAIECDGKLFRVTLTTPVRLLDCRLVAADDERQTILPPPPSYETIQQVKINGSASSPTDQTEFWVQRWPITQDAVWGSCFCCPCQAKLLKEEEKKSGNNSNKNTLTNSQSSGGRSNNVNSTFNEFRQSAVPFSLATTTTTSPSSANSFSGPPPSMQPEWGPPPAYF